MLSVFGSAGLIVVLPALALSSGVFPGVALAEDLVTTPVQVERAEVRLLPSFPSRVQVLVSGQKVVGIDVDVRQARSATDVSIALTQTYPRRLQARLGPFQQPVLLEGGLAPGTYALRVNDLSATFEVR